MSSVGTYLTNELTPNNSPRNFANADTADGSSSCNSTNTNRFASIFNSVMTAPPGLPLFASDGSLSTEGTRNARTPNLCRRRVIPAGDADAALSDANTSIKTTSTFSSYEEKSTYQDKALKKMARIVIDLKDKLKKASSHVATLKNKLISKTRLVKELKPMVDCLMKILVENEQENQRLKKENSALHLSLDEQV